jgi:hypothetical protein
MHEARVGRSQSKAGPRPCLKNNLKQNRALGAAKSQVQRVQGSAPKPYHLQKLIFF